MDPGPPEAKRIMFGKHLKGDGVQSMIFENAFMISDDTFMIYDDTFLIDENAFLIYEDTFLIDENVLLIYEDTFLIPLWWCREGGCDNDVALPSRLLCRDDRQRIGNP